MPLIALKFVLSALIVMIIVGLFWLGAELREAPTSLRGVVMAVLLVALAAAAAGGLWGSGVLS